MNTTNHYATLGLRPSASIEEIELAFKARRSQYHPDRYNQDETATIQWATHQMQLVNEAYRVLSNPGTREAHDQALRQTVDRPQQATGASPTQQNATPLSLRQYLAQASASFAGADRIYLAPHIPLKKLSGALASYGEDLDASDVLVLIDDTVFGGGGDGVLVTETGLLLKSLGSDGRLFQLKAMQALETSKNALYVNGRKLIQLNMPDAQGVDALFGRIRAFAIEKYGTAQQASSAAGSPASGSTGTTAPAGLPTPEQLFKATKAQFGELYRFLRSMEQEDSVDDEAIAALALQYFEATEASLSRGALGQDAYNELGMVYWLTCSIVNVIQGDEEINTNLLRGAEGDGQLVILLRGMLRGLTQEGESEQVRRNADRYFSGE